MFSDDEIKEIPESSFMRPGDEIISVHEVWLSDKCTDNKELRTQTESILPSSVKNDIFRDIFDIDAGATRFAWTEADGNIAELVSEPGFGTTGHTAFGKALDDFTIEMKIEDLSPELTRENDQGCDMVFSRKASTSGATSTSLMTNLERSKSTCKVDKADPRSRFHYVKYLKRQGRTVKLWECGICGREFQHQYTLMRHLPTHTDERNFHCAACGKSFRQLSTLSQHRAIHSADRPYCCEVCNKTFNRVSTLISHRKTHSEEKPYKCHICPKGFHQKGNLRNHLFTHTNERPYRCDICMKGFNQQSNLVCHKNKAHSEDGGTTVVKSRPNSRSKINTLDTQADSTKSIPQVNYCEVTSTVGPYTISFDSPSYSKLEYANDSISLIPATSTSDWSKIDKPITVTLPSTSSVPQKATSCNRSQNSSTPLTIIDSPSTSWSPTITESIRVIDISDPKWCRSKPVSKNTTSKWSSYDEPLNLVSKTEWSDGGNMNMWSSEGVNNSGVVVDPIKTFHMDVAMATKQTPFALLKPDVGTPVLVKVVESKLPNGKQMLVPATANDLRVGGKIVLNTEGSEKPNAPRSQDLNQGMQIRVPVVATVVPKINPGGKLHLSVEEPHVAFHTAMSADAFRYSSLPPETSFAGEVHGLRPEPPALTPAPDRNILMNSGTGKGPGWLQTPPSPPLDLITLDLFDPIELPMGPQITAVEQPPRKVQGSDMFIGEFQETIQLSDSD